MQGQRSSIGALPENLFFENGGSLAGEHIVTSQIPWNPPRAPEQSWPGYTLPMNPSSFPQMHQSVPNEHNLGFLSGEATSSSAARNGGDHINERKPEEDAWNFSSQTVLSFENQQQFGASNGNSLGGNNNTELHLRSNLSNTTRRFSFESPLIRDLNTSSLVEEDDDCQVIEHVQTSIGSSSNSLAMASLESQQASRKRKDREVSGEGSSSFQFHMASDSRNPSFPRQRGIIIGNGSEPSSSRLGIGASEAVVSSSQARSLVAASANADGAAATNRHLWANGSTRQRLRPGNTLSPNAGNTHGASSSSNPVLEWNPSPVMENASNLQGQAMHRNHLHPMWSSGSTRGYVSSSMPQEHNRVTPLQESASRNVSRIIQENNPVFLPAREILNLNQNPTNTNWAGGNFTAGAGNLAPSSSSSQAGPSRGTNLSETRWPHHQAPPQNRRRLQEIIRRSPLPPTGLESGGAHAQNGSNGGGLASLGQRARSALLERRLNAAVGLSRSLRAFSSAGDEGRSATMPEHIRRILDMMRRGEGLRFEDMLILDQSAFFAMADVHDRHRDMRMDVDNMSYEQLLALEERIGDVCTGLSEESIMKHMEQRKYAGDESEEEQCSICREEYNEGEDVGKLDCGHVFHRDCIKQWLLQKNLCPICKTTGLNIQKK